MLPHPAARLLARGPMEASGSIISSRGAPESPSPPCLGSPPSPCEARAEGTDSCPRPPLPGASEGARLCTPESPPSLGSRDRRDRGLHGHREQRQGRTPLTFPARVGHRARPPLGLARPPPRPHLSPTIITAQQAAPRVTSGGHMGPNARTRAKTRAHPQRGPTAFQVEGGAGGQGTGFGIESQT